MGGTRHNGDSYAFTLPRCRPEDVMEFALNTVFTADLFTGHFADRVWCCFVSTYQCCETMAITRGRVDRWRNDPIVLENFDGVVVLSGNCR